MAVCVCVREWPELGVTTIKSVFHGCVCVREWPELGVTTIKSVFHGCVCVCERVARTRGDDYQVGVSWLCVCVRESGQN